jgi:hypothetical protein
MNCRTGDTENGFAKRYSPECHQEAIDFLKEKLPAPVGATTDRFLNAAKKPAKKK